MARGKKTGGRKRGTPNKATAEVKAAAQEFSDEALQTLARVMRKSKSDLARIAAAREILDRAHGRPRQALDIDASDPAPLFMIGAMPDVHPSLGGEERS